MRVAIAAHAAGRAGGIEKYLATIVPALERAGHAIACWFEMGAMGREPLLASGGDVQSWTAADDPNAVQALARWAPDVVYAHGLASPWNERALLDVAPVVFFAHSYYGTCISGTKMHRHPHQQCCTRRFGPACLLEYYPRRCGGRSPVTMLRLYRAQHERLLLLRDYARVLVASTHMAREYERHGLRTTVAPLPIVSADRAGTAAESTTDGAAKLLYLGRVEETKGAHIALQSAALAATSLQRTVHLQISGEGLLLDPLRAEADRVMAQQPSLTVTFTGWLDEQQSSAAIARSDLLLMPSCWPEPFGMVGVEAALHGVPTVAFAVGGIPEWLTDRVTGRLVSANPVDATEFAAAIVSCLSDRDAFDRMRERCRVAASRFALDAHLAQIQSIFAEVSRRRRISPIAE